MTININVGCSNHVSMVNTCFTSILQSNLSTDLMVDDLIPTRDQ